MAIKASKITFWTALASGTGYLALMAFFHAASPTPNVDYLVEMNQKAAAVPEDQRAWPVYRDAWTKFEFSESGTKDRFDEIFKKDEAGKITKQLIRPEDEGWDEAVEKLPAFSELLEAFRAGSKLDHLGLELQVHKSKYSQQDFRALFPQLDYATELQKAEEFGDSIGVAGASTEVLQLLNTSLPLILLPHVQSFRHAARMFRFDTRLAVIENDPDRVVDNIEVILGFARQQRNENIVVCNVIGNAIFKMAVAQVEEVVRESPGVLEDTHLAQLQDAIGEFDFSKIDYTIEQAFLKDILQRIYTDDGNGDGHLTPAGIEVLAILNDMQRHDPNLEQAIEFPWQMNPLTRRVFGPVFMLSSLGRKEVAEQADAFNEKAMARFGTPWWEDDLSDLNEQRRALVLAPAWSHLNRYCQLAIAAQDAGLLGIAIERYRLKYDSWPLSMDDLEGEFFDSIPLDRVTGKPLLFKASDESVTIYSVGGDLDDDGGNHDARTNPMGESYDKSVDGDWVLWPVDRD